LKIFGKNFRAFFDFLGILGGNFLGRFLIFRAFLAKNFLPNLRFFIIFWRGIVGDFLKFRPLFE
jgi:hypothetical protein